jgi:hypothetical protein
MTDPQSAFLAKLLGELRAAHEGSQRLAPSSLRKARDFIRAADTGKLEVSEQEQRELDSLYGLLRWGELVYPMHRIDPELFARERRERRMVRPVPNWRD